MYDLIVTDYYTSNCMRNYLQFIKLRIQSLCRVRTLIVPVIHFRPLADLGIRLPFVSLDSKFPSITTIWSTPNDAT